MHSAQPNVVDGVHIVIIAPPACRRDVLAERVNPDKKYNIEVYQKKLVLPQCSLIFAWPVCLTIFKKSGSLNLALRTEKRHA